MATSFIERTKELRDSYGLTALKAAQQARAESSSPTAKTNFETRQANTTARQYSNLINNQVDQLGSDLTALEGGDPNTKLSTTLSAGTGANTVGELTTGVSSGKITTDTVTGNTNKINAVTPTISASGTTNNQGNSSTVTGGGYGTGGGTNVTPTNKGNVIEGKTNQVLGDVIDNYDKNTTIDKTQFDQQTLAAEANAMEIDTELKRQEFEKNELAKEEDRIQKQKAADDQANLAALQAKEREQNAAAVAALQAKNEAAERDLAIANDVALQQSNVAFAKLGLTLSTAAATTAQKVYTDGVYNLSKLKTEDAYNMSSLQVEVAKVEFDHTAAINKIVNDSSEKSYKIRKTLNDEIGKIKMSIIDNRLSRQEKIDNALDNYQKAVQDNEANTLKLIKDASTSLDDTVKSMYETLKIKEGYNQEKINAVATSGKWFSMSPAQRLEYEKGAGLPKGTVVSQIRSEISKSVVKSLDTIPLSSGKLNAIIDEALKLMDTGGIPMEQAIQSALLNNSEYQTMLKAAEDKKNRVSSGSSSTSSGSWTTTTTVSEDKKNIMQTNKSGEIRWVPIPTDLGKVTTVSSSQSEKKQTTAELLREALAKKKAAAGTK